MASVLVLKAQVIPCITNEMAAYYAAKDPSAKMREDEANERIASFTPLMQKAGGIIYIPVVFHIIHNDGLENISQAQIMDQIRIINEDFRKKTGTPGFSADPLAADCQIEFRLAQYDPNGNKSDGIIRVKSTSTNNATDAVKALSYWDSQRYLNVWVVNTIQNNSGTAGTILGYAQFPWDRSSRPTTDGVVIRSDQVGVIGRGQVSQGGRTLTHEIGHWLGLYHTFQGGCVGGTLATCGNNGDRVCDTPPVSEASSGCNVGANTCNNDVPDLPDMVRNYMDYSDGTCMNIYTTGQKTRMYTNMQAFRNIIYGNGANVVDYAGIDPETGNYKPVNATGYKAPAAFGFESPDLATDLIRLNNFNNSANGWQQNNSVSVSGTKSIYMRNFTNTTALINGRDGFQLPEIDITTITDPYFEFTYAYAQRSTVSTDSLIVTISPNFGMTEFRLFANGGTGLATAAAQSTEFIPQPNEWRTVKLPITTHGSYTNARVRFEFLNRRGNNIYVDNVFITSGPTSLQNQLQQEMQVLVFPNPTVGKNVNLQYTLKEEDAVQLSVFDNLGKRVWEAPLLLNKPDTYTVEIPASAFKPGLYIIEFMSQRGGFNHKLLVN